jgi:hypothetical protein
MAAALCSSVVFFDQQVPFIYQHISMKIRKPSIFTPGNFSKKRKRSNLKKKEIYQQFRLKSILSRILLGNQ